MTQEAATRDYVGIAGLAIIPLVVGLLVGFGASRFLDWRAEESAARDGLDAEMIFLSGQPRLPDEFYGVGDALPRADESGSLVSVFLLGDGDGNAYFVAIRVPKEIKTSASSQAEAAALEQAVKQKTRAFVIRRTGLLAPKFRYVGELTGRLYWYDTDLMCWIEVAYYHHPDADMRKCIEE